MGKARKEQIGTFFLIPFYNSLHLLVYRDYHLIARLVPAIDKFAAVYLRVPQMEQVYRRQSHGTEREDKQVACKGKERTFGQFQSIKPVHIFATQARLYSLFVARKHPFEWFRIAYLALDYTFIIYGTQRAQVARRSVVLYTIVLQPPFVLPHLIIGHTRQGNVFPFIKREERTHRRVVVVGSRRTNALHNGFYKTA